MLSRGSIADCRLPIADCRLPIADCPLPIADCRLPIADCRLPIAENTLMRKQHTLILSILLLTTAATGQQALYQQNSEVNNLMVQYDADRGSLNRFYFVENSPERRNRFIALVTDYEKQVQQLKYDNLPTGSRVDYLLFKRNLDEQLRLLDVEKKECEQVA